MSEDKKVVDVGLLEEEDVFEEFPALACDGKDENHVNVWEDNWDDDNEEEDFAVQLSKINRKRSMALSPEVEPAAKKHCTQPLRNGSSQNGHSKTPAADDVTMEEAEPTVPTPVTPTSRRGRPSRNSRSTSSTNRSEESPSPSAENGNSGGRTLRSSARLRK